MSRICQITGKRRMVGNKVSHSNHKTKKVNEPNIQDKRFWVPSENRWLKLRVSTAAMKIIDKRGIDTVLRELRASGKKV